MSLLPVGIGSEEGGYQIERSLRFNSADSANLTRTPSAASNRKTWTYSSWIKRSVLSSGAHSIFSAGTDGSNRFTINLTSLDVISVVNAVGSPVALITTTAVFRDASAWYHIVLIFDTTQATAANRVRLYVNGVEITSFSVTNYPTQNTDGYVNNNIEHSIGSTRAATPTYLDGYLTEINFIDGQALTPTSFGEFNSDTGVWQPIKYTGTYGTNGFYLNFSDNSGTTSTTLGKDQAGSNNWTPNNFSVTAGAGNDSLVDSPTRYGTDTGAGGTVRGNYSTWNAIDKSTAGVLTNGSLDYTYSGGAYYNGIRSTIGVSSGKWYWETTCTAIGSGGVYAYTGIASNTFNYDGSTNVAIYAVGTYFYQGDGNKSSGTGAGQSTAAYGATYTTNDVIGVALDLDAGTLTFYKNGVSQGTAYSGLSGTFFPSVATVLNVAFAANFGQRPFAYTAPSGFKALVTTNLPTPTIEDGSQYFDVALYTTNGSAQTITTNGNGNALQFTPDFLWNKGRNLVQSHYLANIVTGLGNTLSTDTTAAEAATGLFTAVSQGSFSMASEPAGRTKVTWLWKANGAGVTNTAGTITSTVSVNTTSGFSIVTYTGTGANATVGHGLGVAPSMVIVKRRTGGIQNWIVWHTAIAANEYLYLNLTNAKATGAWNNTAPTSTVFSLDTATEYNATGSTYVAYCFAEVPGYSAFGSYTGNGSADGPFVFTGFRPRYIMQKRTDSTGTWELYDTARDTYNVMSADLAANLSDAETTVARFDSLSNGFKIRTTGAATNASGGTYIYMAFAENPFSIALAR